MNEKSNYDEDTGEFKIDGMESPIIFKSEQMKKVMSRIERIANLDIPILITGETGSGKSLIAKSIHYLGENAKDKFYPVDCGTIAENLVLSKLFGHKKGSFTGAMKDIPGIFTTIGKGTIFLDEIGRQGSAFQAALLRVVEDGKYQPVGETNGKDLESEARVISATNASLQEMIKEGRFRSDLYFRLDRMSIEIPPLRERMEDIKPSIDYFLKIYNENYGKSFELSSSLERDLTKYHFPGNMRQLSSIIDCMVIMEDGEEFYSNAKKNSLNEDEKQNYDLIGEPLKKVERFYIKKALEKNGGVQTRAAKDLGISVRVLRYKIKDI